VKPPIQTRVFPCAFCGEPAVIEIVIEPTKYVERSKIIQQLERRAWACHDHAAPQPAIKRTRPKNNPAQLTIT
jgi:hypothetical protein